MEEKEIDLQECRNKIDKIDKQMAELFENRMRVVSEVAKYKKKHGLKTYDPKREEIIKNRNKCYVSIDLQIYYAELFRKILYLSKKYQKDLSFANNDCVDYQQNEQEK